MTHFESIIFHHNKPKIKLFLQKNKILECWELFSQSPNDPAAELPDPRTQPLPSLLVSVYAPATRRVLLILPSFRI